MRRVSEQEYLASSFIAFGLETSTAHSLPEGVDIVFTIWIFLATELRR